MNHVRNVRSCVRWAVAASAALVVQGCGTTQVSQLRMDGTVIDQPVFPPVSEAWQKAGTFPDIDHLRQVKLLMTKDQLYNLLGRPHFREGLMFVREWDYIFNFRNGPSRRISRPAVSRRPSRSPPLPASMSARKCTGHPSHALISSNRLRLPPPRLMVISHVPTS